MNKGMKQDISDSVVKINTPVHWTTQASEMKRLERLAGGTVRTVSI